MVRQRTQLVNALRGLCAEYGWVVAKGRFKLAGLIVDIEDPSCALPKAARDALLVVIESIKSLEARIAGLDQEIARRAKDDEEARRLMTIPGGGPIGATASTALAPAAKSFRSARDFAAWLGLTPLQHSTGGKDRLGKISKAGERTLRRLLIIGAAAVINNATRRGAPPKSWLAKLLERKPRMLAIVALANKMARIVWALLVTGGVYKAPAVAA